MTRLRLFKEKTSDSASMEDAVLVIDCRKCERKSDFGSGECIKCFCKHMKELGEPERMVLRTATDREFTPEAVFFIRALSRADTAAKAMMEASKSRKCRMCAYSQNNVISGMWESFPSVDVSGAKSLMSGFTPTTIDCKLCADRTTSAVEQLEFIMSEIVMKAVRCTFGITEV